MAEVERRFISLEELAKELAISKRQATTLIDAGELPAIQIGGQGIWRIERAELEKYIERQYEVVRARIAAGTWNVSDE